MKWGYIWLGLALMALGYALGARALEIAGYVIAALSVTVGTRFWTVFSRRDRMFRRAAGGRR